MEPCGTSVLVLWHHTSPHIECNWSQTVCLQDVHGDVQLFSVYVPTNHIYVGDVFLLGKQDIIKVNLSVREGLGKHHLPVAYSTLLLLWHSLPLVHP